jgi:hypothetical protein
MVHLLTIRNEVYKMPKYDKRRKYYMVLDCETATLPCASQYTEEERKNVAIAKPLIYDLGWKIVDRNGVVYNRENYLITEIFSVPQIFDTAYYKDKRPIYLEKLRKGEIILTNWETAMTAFLADLEIVESVGAYNSMFDFKKAVPFTELYITKLYSADYHNWLKWQENSCKWIAEGNKIEGQQNFEESIFRFRGKTYPLFDLWGLTCEHILNCDEYKQMCIDQKWETASGKYFKTSAETAFRFFSGNTDFIECHTAIDDVEIETQLFAEIVKRTKNKWELGIECFPFRLLGTVENYLSRG